MKHAKEYPLDKSQIILSGFSAGGNTSLTAALRLHPGIRRMTKLGAGEIVRQLAKPTLPIGTVLGIISIYAGLDNTSIREEKILTSLNAEAESAVPNGLYKLFEDPYLFPPSLDRSSLFLWPFLASAAMLKQALPQIPILYTCEWDQVLLGCEAFRQRLKDLREIVKDNMTRAVVHT
ncbi:hypothetical protein MMC19_001099 [Ptychographa xylographoides]|nr:hypothetical protein [Ptychographa xylographoides]